ncbi:class B sortase [Paraclostridium bifermentans]|uniref:class B sortase n=1 Tax=Paraclostridium bifermentans TaxID=1490 RepID=UPI00374F256B
MNLRTATATTVLIIMAGYSTLCVADHLKNTSTETGLMQVSMIDTSDEGAVNNYKQKLKEHMVQGYEKALETNDDTVGWIHVEDTRVDYPIMSGDNNFYLNYNSSKQPSKSGSIFLDDSELWIGDLSVIHGHNMKNGTMFSDVRKFVEKKFFNNHSVYIYDGTELREYRPIAFLKINGNSKLQTTLKDKKEIQKYAESLVKESDFGHREVNENPVLVMNTCVSDGTEQHYILVSQEVSE